ncbi:hypothetical protein I79_005801 [Cricetulus griseus]|uniref:Uncharacterized protein n=1 Tax=Cricetulus griseus TaxID=10029 RepID=G3H650_CRIGR|nr:hypothetical protein I79_005801 [Cricetulus griseus]
MLHKDLQHAPLRPLLLTLQRWVTNEDLSAPLQASSDAALASDLKVSLLLRSSFSTGIHLLPAPPGTQHCTNSLDTCSYGSEITEEQ